MSNKMQRYTVYLYLEITLRCVLLDICWNILTMHGPINVKSPNNASKWQMGFNPAFKGLTLNSMAQFHTSVTLLKSRDLAWSSGRLTCQQASHISDFAHIS
jgi:hypothetical protein